MGRVYKRGESIVADNSGPAAIFVDTLALTHTQPHTKLVPHHTIHR